MQAPVIFVVGPVGHGKTTVRELLVELTHLRGGSCSDIIYQFLAIRKEVSVESLRQLPKEHLRPELIEAGDYLCGSVGTLKEVPKNPEVDTEVWCHPSALIRTLYLNGVNVIDGVRRRLELVDASAHLEWNGVRHLTIHVQRPDASRVPDNSEDLRELADELIANDGTVEELRERLKAILDKHFGKQDELPEPPMPIVDVPAPAADPVPRLSVAPELAP